MVLQVLSMQGEMLELAAKECTRSDVFTGQEAYVEYTNVLNKIMEESVLSFDPVSYTHRFLATRSQSTGRMLRYSAGLTLLLPP